MCNSREFKDFLGSEDQDEVSVLKPTKVSKRQVMTTMLKKFKLLFYLSLC